MPLLAKARSWVRNLFRARRAEAELDEEVQTHLEMLVEENVRAGMTGEEARRKARIELGGVDQVKEQVHERQIGNWSQLVWADCRYSARQLRKNPAFAIVAVVTLALGIGANSTIFAMVSRFVLHSAPVGDPATLLTLHTTDHNECCNAFSWPLFTDVRDNAKSFSGVTGFYELLPASLSGNGDPQRYWGQATATNFFDVAQLAMTLGRGFRPEEQTSPVIVLGNRVWKARFNSDPEIAGKSIAVSGRPFTVVGVAPPYFRGFDLILDAQFWVPIGNIDQLLPNTSHFESRSYHWITVAGRLKPGVSRREAAAELQVLAQRAAELHGDTEKNLGFRFEQAGSLPPRDKGAILLFLTTLMMVVFLVLLIACANVANLFLGQASGRQREMAVRVALGATRSRLLRQILIESTLLSLTGGLLGVLLSMWATNGLSAFRFPVPVSIDLNVGIDWKVIGFTFLVSLAAGVVFGLLPGWTAAWRFASITRQGEESVARPGRFWTMRNALVVAQISMSLILLCITGLCLRSLRSAGHINIGFRSNGVIAMSVDPRLHGYTPERTVQFLSELQRRVSVLPGVRSAAITDALPLSGGHRSDGFQAIGKKPVEPTPSTELYMATPGYLNTMGIQLLDGRDFSQEAASLQKAAIVNEVFVEKFFPKENPIGQLVSGGGVTYEIIGVTNNIKARFLGESLRPVLFRSLAQTVASDPSFEGYTVIASTAAESSAVASSMRAVIREMDPALAVFNEQTMEHHLREALFLPRLAGTLFAVFGIVGMLLAAIGLYGVVDYSVRLRVSEIGIRMALGARACSVQRLFIRRGLQLIAIGTVIGLPAAFLIARLFSAILYGIKPHDAVTFISVPLFLGSVALLATYIPARRATKVEPMVALRCE